MTLTEEAWLEITDGEDREGQFQLKLEFEETTELEKSYIMAERGQYIREVANHLVEDVGVDDIKERRAGFWIDGGAGQETITVTFETGLEDVTWGNGDGGDGPANTSELDASGADVHPLTRKQVLEHWLRITRTDSFGQARLHVGEWTDGTVGSASAGIFGQPIPVAVVSTSFESPDPNEDINSMQGTITMNRVALFPMDTLPSWVTDAADKIQDLIDGINDG